LGGTRNNVHKKRRPEKERERKRLHHKGEQSRAVSERRKPAIKKGEKGGGTKNGGGEARNKRWTNKVAFRWGERGITGLVKLKRSAEVSEGVIKEGPNLQQRVYPPKSNKGQKQRIGGWYRCGSGCLQKEKRNKKT